MSIKSLILIINAMITLCIVVMAGCFMAVRNAANNKIYSKVEVVPHRKVALLLGTNPIGRTGRRNQFFLRRLDATEALYKAGKIDKILISGAAHPENNYDEPAEMMRQLIERGVPQNVFILDKEGFRTINSVVRAKEVFGVDSVLIISQKFHNERALFLAKHKGLDAIAYNATNTSSKSWRRKMFARELLARVKAVLEIL